MRKYTFANMSSAPNTGAVAPLYVTKEQKAQQEREQNAGGFLGGLGYLAEKAGTSFFQSVEGIWDYTAGGLAKLFGADDWAEEQFESDWFGDWYSHPDEWYNPSGGWKVAGDVAGGIGTSLPGIAAAAAATAITVASGGTASPLAIGIISGATAGLGAAGTGTKEAYRETGKLGGEEFLYGGLSGVVEGGTEGLTNALTLGTGTVIKNIGKSMGKEVTATVAKKSVAKSLLGAFGGEAFEEGFSEWINPYLKRATYDADAENASLSEISYAAFVGGLAGMVMDGANISIDTANSLVRGTSLTNRGAEGEVLSLSANIAAFEDANTTGNEVYAAVAETYKKLSESLAKTDGKVQTAYQKKLLGDLQRGNVAAVFTPMVTKSAANIYQNAEAIAARLTEYGYTDADGNAMNFTAEQIREGIMPGDKKSFAKALKENSVLRTLAVSDVTGHLMMDTNKFRDATLMGRNLASRADLWRFAETATGEEIRAVSEALGIENWETLTEDDFADKIATFLQNGGATRYAEERAAADAVFADESEGIALPSLVAIGDGQMRKYTDGGETFAISRKGDEYRVYDYATRKASRAMDFGELNRTLRARKESGQTILSDLQENVRTEAEIKRKTEEADTFASENVKKYAELPSTVKTMIRKVIRAGRELGLADADIKMYANVSAHSGIDIVFSKRLCKRPDGYADGFYDPRKNRIVVNPEGKRSAEKILLHELDHAVRSGIRADGDTVLFTQAINSIDEKALQKITEMYKNVESDVTQAELIMDEANAYFAETVFANKNVLESLTEKVPSLKERIISFFKGASADYTGVDKLEGAAKRYYKLYKKMFDEFAARNEGNNAEGASAEGVRYALTIGDNEVPVDVEANKDLVAIHNLTESNLLDTLKLGGFPMPSIAVVKAETGHSEYGDISVIFGRETIDPEISAYNKLYGGDAWTPVYPTIEYKANAETIKNISALYRRLEAKYGRDVVNPLYEYINEAEKILTRKKGINGVISELRNDTDMMRVFLADSEDKIIPLVEKETVMQLNSSTAEMYDFLTKELGKDFFNSFNNSGNEPLFTYRRKWIEKNKARFQEVYERFFAETFGFTDEEVETLVANQTPAEIKNICVSVINYLSTGGKTVKKETDDIASKQAVIDAVDTTKYEKWLENVFGNLEEKSGIYNGKDPFTAKGNRRSFEALHYENTLENVVKMMRKGENGDTLFGGQGIWGVSSKAYKSINEAKADSSRLFQMNEEEYKAQRAEFTERLADIAQKISNTSRDNQFSALDDAARNIVDALRKSKNAKKVFEYIRQYNPSITMDIANDIVNLANDIANMPTEYFEAKPMRAVDFSEVKTILLPDKTSANLKTELEERRIPYEVYGSTDEERTAHLQSLSGIRFALPMDDEAIETMLDEAQADGAVFDREAIISRGAPVMPGSKRAKVYDRSNAVKVFNKLADKKFLKRETKKEFTDMLNDALNRTESRAERKRFVHDAANFYVAKLLDEGQKINPEYDTARETEMNLQFGIGQISFSYDDIVELRARLDDTGIKHILGRWGAREKATPTPLNQFQDTVARDVPGMAYIGEMHPVDAILKIDEIYNEAKKTTGSEKYVSLYPNVTDAEIETMVKSAEDAINKGFEARDMAITSQNFEALEAQALKKTVRQEARAEIKKSQDIQAYRTNIQSRVNNLAQMRDGAYKNSPIFKDSELKKIQTKLTSIAWKKTISEKQVREAMKDLSAWYRLDNNLIANYQRTYFPIFEQVAGEWDTSGEFIYIDPDYQTFYDKNFAEKIKALAKGEGAITAKELAELDKVLDHLTKLIRAHSKRYIDPKSVNYNQKLKEAQAKFREDLQENARFAQQRTNIAISTEKLLELKKGTYQNSAVFKDNTFDKVLQELTSIGWRKSITPKRVRKVMTWIADWYSTENKLLGYENGENPGLYDVEIAEKIKALAKGEGKITSEDLKELDQIIGYMTNFVKKYNKVYQNGKWVDAKPVAQAYIDIMRARGEMKDVWFTNFGRKYLMTFGDVVSNMRYYDGYNPYGFWTQKFEELRAGAIEAETQKLGVMRKYDAFMDKNKKYLKTAKSETVEFMGVQMPKLTAISLYMTMKREQAQKGLAVGGFSYRTEDGKTVRLEGIALDIKPAADAELTAEQRAEKLQQMIAAVEAKRKELEGLLSEKDMEYIAILEEGYNVDAKRLKAARDLEKYGFTNAEEGYYYPIRRAYSAKSVDISASAELDRVSKAGFNKDIVKGAAGELFIQDADSLFRNHVDAVCKYYALSPAIESYNKIFNMDISGEPNHPVSVRTESANIWPKAHEYFRDLIGDVQGVPRDRGMGMDILGKIRGTYAKFQLGANPKTVLTQTSSIFAATSILDYDSIVKAVKISGKDAAKYSALAELRAADNTAAMAQGVLTPGKRVKYGIDAVSDTLMKPIGWMDSKVINRLFAVCQAQTEKNGGGKVGTEQNKVEAAKLLERVILETQQNSFATERSAAMRSGNEIMRTLTMFSADAMKTTARVIDAFGEISAIRAKMKNDDADTKKALQTQLKAANKRLRKSAFAMTMVAVWSASIAQLFRWLYDKEKDEDETVLSLMLVDAGGSLFGGLPLAKELYNKFTDGYDTENYSLAMLNDLMDSTVRLFDTGADILKGKASNQDVTSGLKSLAYSLGQFSGIPVRNLYNMLYGLTKRFVPTAAYKWDEAFYEKNYTTDLRKAVEEDDMQMANMLLSLAAKERVGDVWSEATHTEMLRLFTAGYNILPREIPKTITVDGNEYEMSEDERDMLRTAYADITDKLDKLCKNAAFMRMSDEQKAETIKTLYTNAYNSAVSTVFGIDKGNAARLEGIIGADVLAIFATRTKGISSDKTEDGKSVAGSKRKKMIAAINTLSLPIEKKLLLICAKGYTIADGDVRGMSAEAAKKKLLAYIVNMPGKSKEERQAIAEMCGFTVQNGKIIMQKAS